jgi:hypothetical protein
MNIASIEMPVHCPGHTSPRHGVERQEATDIEVTVAVTLSDFMQAMPFMKRVAMETCAPIAPNSVGAMLARMNYGGSGHETGCVVLARHNKSMAGFAVLAVKPDIGLELTWLHAGGEKPDRIVDGLWRTVSEIKAEWDFPILHVGYFTDMPKAMRDRVSIR